jgi:hypothetical protein
MTQSIAAATTTAATSTSTNLVARLGLFVLTQWHLRVLAVVNDFLETASTWRLMDALDLASGQEGEYHHGWEVVEEEGALGPQLHVGAMDRYNWSCRIRRDSVQGTCGYGSYIYVDATNVRINTCGGHWVRAELVSLPNGTTVNGQKDLTIWTADDRPSLSAWADMEFPDECRIGDGYYPAGRAGLDSWREGRLKAAFANVA